MIPKEMAKEIVDKMCYGTQPGTLGKWNKVITQALSLSYHQGFQEGIRKSAECVEKYPPTNPLNELLLSEVADAVRNLEKKGEK